MNPLLVIQEAYNTVTPETELGKEYWELARSLSFHSLAVMEFGALHEFEKMDAHMKACDRVREQMSEIMLRLIEANNLTASIEFDRITNVAMHMNNKLTELTADFIAQNAA